MQIEIQEIPFKYKKNKTFLRVRVVKHWNKLPGEAVESLAWQLFKTYPDATLSYMLYLSLHLVWELD